MEHSLKNHTLPLEIYLKMEFAAFYDTVNPQFPSFKKDTLHCKCTVPKI